MRIILALALVSLGLFLAADKTHALVNAPAPLLSCGGADIQVTQPSVPAPGFVVRLDTRAGPHTFLYSAENDLLMVRCERSKNGQEFVLLSHQRLGSACSNQNFGIIDPRRGKELVTPSDRYLGTYARAKKILGKHFNPFRCDSFDKQSALSTHAGALCIRSRFELGMLPMWPNSSSVT